jgi:hypothetical protein
MSGFPSSPPGENIYVGKPLAVYLGSRISPEQKREVFEICRAKDIPCYQMTLSFENFELVPRKLTTFKIETDANVIESITE